MILTLFDAATDINDRQSEENGQREDCVVGIDFGGHDPVDGSVDVGGKIVGAEGEESAVVARIEEADQEVVDRHREGDEHPGEDARADGGDDDFDDAGGGFASEVEGGVIQVFIEFRQFGKDGQNDIGHTEEDVGDDHRSETEDAGEEVHDDFEDEHQRQPRDDIGVEDGNLVEQNHRLPLLLGQRVDSDGDDGAKDGGDEGGDQRDD